MGQSHLSRFLKLKQTQKHDSDFSSILQTRPASIIHSYLDNEIKMLQLGHKFSLRDFEERINDVSFYMVVFGTLDTQKWTWNSIDQSFKEFLSSTRPQNYFPFESVHDMYNILDMVHYVLLRTTNCNVLKFPVVPSSRPNILQRAIELDELHLVQLELVNCFDVTPNFHFGTRKILVSAIQKDSIKVFSYYYNLDGHDYDLQGYINQALSCKSSAIFKFCKDKWQEN